MLGICTGYIRNLNSQVQVAIPLVLSAIGVFGGLMGLMIVIEDTIIINHMIIIYYILSTVFCYIASTRFSFPLRFI